MKSREVTCKEDRIQLTHPRYTALWKNARRQSEVAASLVGSGAVWSELGFRG